METQEDWLACTDLTPMLEFLRGKASDRKLRLFACACCRRIWHLLTDRRTRRAVEIAEQYADGRASMDDLKAACDDAWAFVDWGSGSLTPADTAAACTAEPMSGAIAARDILTCGTVLVGACDLLCDIFGNPFRPVTVDAAWLMPGVVELARTIYEGRNFDRMPELADALEEAGCHDPDILAHCREPGQHVRGCWVVDLILGKE
jgi:hypothetical protein